MTDQPGCFHFGGVYQGNGTTCANCDGSIYPQVLNINDFICFLSRFGAGCS